MAKRTRLPGAVPVRRRRRRQLAGHARPGHQHDGRRAHRRPPHHRRRATCRCWSTSTPAGAARSTSRRTVRSLIKAGAAAVHIEDQVGAKRCGHRPGKEVVSKDEMVDRVKAAVDARDRRRLRDHGAHRRGRGRGHRAGDRARDRLRRGRRRHDLPRGDLHARAVPPVQGRGEGADPGQHHRVRADAVVHHRRTARRPASTSRCIAAAPTAR